MSKSRLFFYINICFVLGVGVASFLSIFCVVNALFYFVLFLFCLFVSIVFSGSVRIKALVGAFLFLGIWVFVFDIQSASNPLVDFVERTVLVRAEVVEEVKIAGAGRKAVFEVIDIAEAEVEGARVLVYFLPYPKIAYGDDVLMKCDLKRPESFEGFNYEGYLARQGIYGICYYPKIVEAKKSEDFVLFKYLLVVKDRIRDAISKGLNEPEAGLLKAILLGDKKSVDDDLKTVFSRVGLSHIIAISGLHFGILVMVFIEIFLIFGFRRRVAFWLTVFVLFLYLLIIGAPISSVRAGMMAFLYFFAISIGRIGRVQNSLLFAAAIMLLFDPQLFRSDVSFQLSFLAVLGIVCLNPILSRWLRGDFWDRLKVMKEILLVSLSVQVFTWPIVAYNFGVFSVMAPVANIFALWTLPPLIVFSLVAILLSMIFPGVAFVLFFPVYVLIKYIEVCAGFFEKVPFSYIENIELSGLVVMLYYFVLVFVFALRAYLGKGERIK